MVAKDSQVKAEERVYRKKEELKGRKRLVRPVDIVILDDVGLDSMIKKMLKSSREQ